MTFYKKIPFSFNDKAYEIRILHDDKLINMVAFYQNYPANGFRYQIHVPKYAQMDRILDSDVIQEFVELCKNDIVQNRWQRLLEK